jgi:hypothetical protein
MPTITLAPLSGRYLTFAEREEIAILRARDVGVRAIARSLGRAASTISRELRRNAATRGGYLDYRASTAQWHADRRARRPKPAKHVRVRHEAVHVLGHRADPPSRHDLICRWPATFPWLLRRGANSLRSARQLRDSDRSLSSIGRAWQGPYPGVPAGCQRASRSAADRKGAATRLSAAAAALLVLRKLHPLVKCDEGPTPRGRAWPGHISRSRAASSRAAPWPPRPPVLRPAS